MRRQLALCRADVIRDTQANSVAGGPLAGDRGTQVSVRVANPHITMQQQVPAAPISQVLRHVSLDPAINNRLLIIRPHVRALELIDRHVRAAEGQSAIRGEK